MQEVDLLLSFAEIAGVFVGFGALIAVRAGGASSVAEVAYMRAVVSMGMLTVVAALAPVVVGRYDLGAHEIWALSSGLVFVGWFVMLLFMGRTPEYRANWAAEFGADRMMRSRRATVGSAVALVMYQLAVLLVPIIIVLGLLSETEAALYITLVVLILLGAGWTLLTLVFSQRGPATT